MLTDQNGHTIPIDSREFDRGGEGVLFLAQGRYRGMIFKRYLNTDIARDKQPKIRFMIQHSPLKNSHPDLKRSVIWPEVMVFEQQTFVGYLMPLVEDTIRLTWLIRKPLKLQKIGQHWQQFDWDNPRAQRIRLQLCLNIARALNLIHTSGTYVLVDFKPDNVRVNPRGIVSLIDMDSVQIKSPAGLSFPAEVSTPEYSPPEATKFKKNSAGPGWDYFSFAVTAYRILVYPHPFAMLPGIENQSLDEHIRLGYFAHSPRFSHRLNPFHKPFLTLPKPVRRTFHHCFETALFKPRKRPDFDRWITALTDGLQGPSHAKPKSKATPRIKVSLKPATIYPGQMVTLSWQATHCHVVDIAGLGRFHQQGRIPLYPTQSQTYRLSTPYTHPPVETHVQITVQADPKVHFELKPSHIRAGQATELRWQVDRQVKQVILQGIGRVKHQGRLAVKPQQSGIYRLTAYWQNQSIHYDRYLFLKP